MSDYSEHLISMAGGDGDPLDAIQRRADKATAGPWDVDSLDATIYSRHTADPLLLFAAHEDHVDGYGVPSEDCTDDAEFIAHARTDVPALIALVREQKARLAVVAELANWAGKHGWKLDAAALRAALEPTP